MRRGIVVCRGEEGVKVDDVPEFVSIEQLATALGLNLEVARRHVRKKVLRPVGMKGNARQFDRVESIVRFRAAQIIRGRYPGMKTYPDIVVRSARCVIPGTAMITMKVGGKLRT